MRVGGAWPVPQDGLFGLERLAAITAETDRGLRKVEQVRERVQREMSGAEIQLKLSGHNLLIRRPVLGERLHRRLDAPQTPDVGERPGNGAALGSVELARRRASWRSDRRGRGTMPAAVAAASRHQPEYGDGERESPVADGAPPAVGTGNRDILIEPSGSPPPWDLDHSDDRSGYLGVPHRRCNRSAPSKGRRGLPAELPQPARFSRDSCPLLARLVARSQARGRACARGQNPTPSGDE